MQSVFKVGTTFKDKRRQKNMPGGDRTGPEGYGPRTARRLGYCAGYDSPTMIMKDFEVALKWLRREMLRKTSLVL